MHRAGAGHPDPLALRQRLSLPWLQMGGKVRCQAGASLHAGVQRRLHLQRVCERKGNAGNLAAQNSIPQVTSMLPSQLSCNHHLTQLLFLFSSMSQKAAAQLEIRSSFAVATHLRFEVGRCKAVVSVESDSCKPVSFSRQYQAWTSGKGCHLHVFLAHLDFLILKTLTTAVNAVLCGTYFTAATTGIESFCPELWNNSSVSAESEL